MESDDIIQVGQLVTVKQDSYGLDAILLEDSSKKDKTIYPWDNTKITRGTVGLVLGSIKNDTLFLKVLWTINRESVLLYVRIHDLKSLNYDT